MTATPKLRLAIVGASTRHLRRRHPAQARAAVRVSIDLFEQLPAPYGLVRYGVAPDHPRIKGIITALREVLDTGRIRIFGNVRYGQDITLEDLQRHYHAVIFSTGAVRDADLDIPGIDLPGSYGAADVVSWYDGHPDVPREWPLEAESIAVIGNGNVALDVAPDARQAPEDLMPTGSPRRRRGARGVPVADVHVFGRRGPMQVKFTPLELRELGGLRDVDMIVHGGLRLRRGRPRGDRLQQAAHGHRPRLHAVAPARGRLGEPPSPTCTSGPGRTRSSRGGRARRGDPGRAHRAGWRGRRRGRASSARSPCRRSTARSATRLAPARHPSTSGSASSRTAGARARRGR